MKRTVLISLLALSAHAQAMDAEKIADAIYRAEGGERARVPYGILTVKVHDVFDARNHCLSIIQKNFRAWQDAGAHGDFIDFLADHYCPPAVDPVGNSNWKHNVKFFLK